MATESSAVSANREDLERFQALLGSPIRSDERETALHEWEKYKLSRQAAVVAGEKRSRPGRGLQKRGVWTKRDYMRALTARAIDLTGATFTDVCLGYADLRGVCFDDAVFSLRERQWSAMKGVRLEGASLRGARLGSMRLMQADLRGADLSGATLTGADLSDANLGGAILRDAHLDGVNLERANLVGADISGCRLDHARVYGVSAWDVVGRPASSRDLVVTPAHMPRITADDLRVAQFVYLLVHNPQIRDVLDTVTRKVVLLLGRFTPERKLVLDSLRDALRRENLVPVLLDFELGEARSITETVTLLARMARFVIADLTEPASIPQELQAIAPDVAVPIRLIIAEGHKPYVMSNDLRRYHWVLKPWVYKDAGHLLANLREEVIDVADRKRRELEGEATVSD